jgi:hypothetical protein
MAQTRHEVRRAASTMQPHHRIKARSIVHHNREEYSMSFRRAAASILFTFATVSIGGSSLAAQLSGRGTSLLVPITGVTDQAGIFDGTLLVEQFAPQADGVATVGTVTGTLTVNGTIRTIVTQVTLPLDIAASRARLNTDAALAQASCDVLHMELGGASVNVLGFTIGLNPVAFDIASAVQAGSTTAAAPTAARSTAAAAQSGTVTASASTNTTQPGMVAPSTSVAATTAPQTAAQPPLATQLCSVDRFRDVSSPAKLVQQLNGILMALGATQGQ